MSVIPQSTTAAAPFDDETPEVEVRYTFKLTAENKTEQATLCLNEKVLGYIKETVARSARWRSNAQFFNDAMVYYLNDESDGKSVDEIVDGATWSSDFQTSFSITETLWNEIDLLVKHGHTGWDSKQEFYICALFCYIGDGLPAVNPR